MIEKKKDHNPRKILVKCVSWFPALLVKFEALQILRAVSSHNW